MSSRTGNAFIFARSNTTGPGRPSRNAGAPELSRPPTDTSSAAPPAPPAPVPRCAQVQVHLRFPMHRPAQFDQLTSQRRGGAIGGLHIAYPNWMIPGDYSRARTAKHQADGPRAAALGKSPMRGIAHAKPTAD